MSNRLGGTLGQAYRGTAAENPGNVTIENRAPTQWDINYSVGDTWVYQDLSTTPTTNTIYMLSSLQGDGTTLGEKAWWKVINTSVAPTGLQTLTSSDTTVITPIADNINIYGDGTMITTTGAADTLTVSMAGGAAGQLLISDPAGAKYLAPGNSGELLMSQGAGADPVWSTADFPATVAKGDILAATAANVVGVIPTAGATNGYVLTATGAGNVPTWQTNPADGIVTLAGDSGTATGSTVTIAGGTNLTTAAAAATVTINLDAAISGTTSHVFADTGYLGTGTTAGDTLLLQAYDVDGAAYVPLATLTANDTPTMDLDTSVTINSSYIYRAGGTDIPVTDGGTGASTLTQHGLLVGSGVGAIGVIDAAAATTGHVLTAINGAAPTFQAPSSGDGWNYVAMTGDVANPVSGTMYTRYGAGSAATWTITLPNPVTVGFRIGVLTGSVGAGETRVSTSAKIAVMWRYSGGWITGYGLYENLTNKLSGCSNVTIMATDDVNNRYTTMINCGWYGYT